MKGSDKCGNRIQRNLQMLYFSGKSLIMYVAGQVYRINFKYGYFTYVIIEPHPVHLLAFRSLAGKPADKSIKIERLKDYDTELVCTREGKRYDEILAEIEKGRQTHEWLWKKRYPN